MISVEEIRIITEKNNQVMIDNKMVTLDYSTRSYNESILRKFHINDNVMFQDARGEYVTYGVVVDFVFSRSKKIMVGVRWIAELGEESIIDYDSTDYLYLIK